MVLRLTFDDFNTGIDTETQFETEDESSSKGVKGEINCKIK